MYSEAQKIASYCKTYSTIGILIRVPTIFLSLILTIKPIMFGYDGTTDIKFDTLYDNVQYDNVNSTGNIIIDLETRRWMEMGAQSMETKRLFLSLVVMT